MGGYTVTAFAAELAKADLQVIAAGIDRAKRPLDFYLVVRSLFVLGRYSEAETQLKKCRGELARQPFIESFISAQRELYSQGQVEGALRSLISLAGKLPEKCEYLQADYHFVLGYAYARTDEVKTALRHHEQAARLYEGLRLPGHESQALFNVAVSSNHLGLRQSVGAAVLRLDKLARAYPSIAVIQLFLKRIQAYQLVDAEDFAGAYYAVCEVLALAEEEGRLRDMGGMYCLCAYLLLRAYDLDEFRNLYLKLSTVVAALPREHQVALAEFRALESVRTLDAVSAKKWMARWRRLGVDSVHLLFLHSLLLERVQAGGDYECLIRLAVQAQLLAKRHHQALTLVDFRRFEIVGLAACGRGDKAMAVLKGFRDDALIQRSSFKLSFAKQFSTKLMRQFEGSFGLVSSFHPNPSAKPLDNSMRIDPVARTICYRGNTILLRTSPIVFKFIKLLVLKGKPVKLPEFFRQCYGILFDPVVHQSRFNSLIDRARSLLGDSGAIVREAGTLFLNERIEPSLEPSSASLQTMLSRRDQLVKAIVSAQRPVSISELERQFDCTRRTIQLDLAELVSFRTIACSGGTKNRRYSAWKD